jgi:hypothetical protein
MISNSTLPSLSQLDITPFDKKLTLTKIIHSLLKIDIMEFNKNIKSYFEYFKTINLASFSEQALENFVIELKFSADDLHRLLLKLYYFMSCLDDASYAEFSNNLHSLTRATLKQKILSSNDYSNILFQLDTLKKNNELSLSEQICRYFICFNAAISSGTIIYEMATTLLLSAPLVIASGAISLILCGLLANYFINLCKEEDDKLKFELEVYEKTINYIAGRESIIRLRCYSLISQIISLHKEFEKIIDEKISDPIILSLIRNWNESRPLITMDEYINSRLKEHPVEASTVAEINNFNLKKFNSIYLNTFQSNWGPALSFLGATGTLFFISKTILALPGIVAMVGSSIGFLGLLAGTAIIFSLVFAYQHRKMNLHLDTLKQDVNSFKINEVDKFKIRCDLLKRTRIELLIDFINVQQLIRKNYIEAADPELSENLEKKINRNLAFSTDCTYAGSRLMLFHKANVLAASSNKLEITPSSLLSCK